MSTTVSSMPCSRSDLSGFSQFTEGRGEGGGRGRRRGEEGREEEEVQCLLWVCCECLCVCVRECKADWVIPVHVLIRKEKLLSDLGERGGEGVGGCRGGGTTKGVNGSDFLACPNKFFWGWARLQHHLLGMFRHRLALLKCCGLVVCMVTVADWALGNPSSVLGQRVNSMTGFQLKSFLLLVILPHLPRYISPHYPQCAHWPPERFHEHYLWKRCNGVYLPLLMPNNWTSSRRSFCCLYILLLHLLHHLNMALLLVCMIILTVFAL